MKKYIQVATCAAMISVCLFGCGKREHDITPEIKESTTAVSEMEIPENVTIGESVAPRTQHITQNIVENMTIDAEAVIPRETQYSTYTLKGIDGAPDRLFCIFSPEGYGSFTTEISTKMNLKIKGAQTAI